MYRKTFYKNAFGLLCPFRGDGVDIYPLIWSYNSQYLWKDKSGS